MTNNIKRHETDMFYSRLDWDEISDQRLSENFIRKFFDKVNWELITCHRYLTEEFLREFEDFVCWENLAQSRYYMTSNLIRDYADRLDWEDLSDHELSVDICREFYDRINWHTLTERLMTMGYDFIINNPNAEYTYTPTLNIEFLKEFEEKLDWEVIDRYKVPRIIEEFKR